MDSSDTTSPNVRPWYSMRALGRDDPPATFDLGGKTYRRVNIVKHDFIAATAFYEDADGHRVVLKIGRTVRFAGLGFKWLGRWLCGRETRFYRQLAGTPNVPTILGDFGETGFVHDYVPGRLEKGKPVPDGFFNELQSLLLDLHRRGMAYVDTNKPQNILLGDDGRPHLIDFQISADLKTVGNNFLGRWWLKRLQRADLYHVLKHKRRMRPDELTEEERREAEKIGFWIRLHRIITRPYFVIRRRLFGWLRRSGRVLPEGSE